MYRNGNGVTQDYAESVKWYRKAAERGYAWAQHNLGVMYTRGLGVVQNYVDAHVWLDLAAKQGNKKAAEISAIVAELMTPAQIAEAQRLAREWLAKRGKK